jgi:dolichol-phosphate mannosyltransferase
MITIVVPVHNEADNIFPLMEKITEAAKTAPITEVIYVDDGSTDATPEKLSEAAAKHKMLRVLRHSVKSGQSAGLWTGISHARNGLIVTLDGDGQNDPADIALLYDAYQHAFIERAGRIMVAGQREKRHDSRVRRMSSRIANKVRSRMLSDGVRDTGCSLKLFTRDDFLMLPRMNHLHRFLPALMMREGVRVVLRDVSHSPRLHGASKYGTWDRLWVGIADLFGVRWLQSRAFCVTEISEITRSKANERVSDAA